METTEVTLDYSGKGLEKIDKATEEEAKNVVTLKLDDNDLNRIDGVESYHRLENLSICKNNLLRMYGVGRLTSLRHLNLSNNALLTIEGLKELVYLKKLELACNNIKSIEHLNNNVNLEYLDLSGNQITHLSDISYLKNLKHLFLDRNGIGNLRQGERYLPGSLISLGLSQNYLTDLNTLSHLAHLGQLENIHIEGNPCIMPKGSQEKIDFDYRPFVINWVMNVKTVDGFEVTPIESLKAEWLYSQGQGRKFREGEQEKLVEYLCSICPKGDTVPETEDQKKLQLILTKAQQHQQQLREQGPSPLRAKHSPRMHSRITGRLVNKSPDHSMSSSFHATLSNKHHDLLTQQSKQMSASFSGEIPLSHPVSTKSTIPTRIVNETSSIMNQSLDATTARLAFSGDITPKDAVVSNGILLEKNIENVNKTSQIEKESTNVVKDTNKDKQKIEANLDNINKCLNQPLEAASKMVPVPDSLMSPDYQGPLFTSQSGLIINQSPHGPNRKAGANFSPGCQIPPVQTYSPGIPVKNITSNTPTTNNEQKKVPHKSPATTRALAPNSRNNTASPQLSRSAMSSPKSRNNKDQRKGSFSSKMTHNNEENHIQTAKNLYNQSLQQSSAKMSSHPNNASNKKINGSHKVITALSNQREIQVTPPDSRGANSSDDDSEMCAEKLQSIRDAANQRRQKQSASDSLSSDMMGSSTNKSTGKAKTAYCAAVTIQKLWRGYRTRNLSHKTGNIIHAIQTMRARQYIEKLSSDMEVTKAALDSERKIQQLQMQAINTLWNKISAMENNCGKGDDKIDSNILTFSENNDKISNKDDAVRELTQTCSMLQAQVQQLQGSMRDILTLVSGKQPNIIESKACGGIATQTEISAVHTPQGETSGVWPYQKAVSRPCSLSLTVQNNNLNKSQSESVQSEEKKKDQGSSSIEKETLLPGQTDKHDITENNVKKVPEKKSSIEMTYSVDAGGDHFSQNLKKECLGIEKALIVKDHS